MGLLRDFGGFQETNFGRTLVVLFQLLTLVLGSGLRNRHKISAERIGRDVKLGWRSIFMRFFHLILLIFLCFIL